jgi:hypothetical protein
MTGYKLPVEIYEKIFSYINDTNTYLNIRLTCKLFYNLHKNIKIFENKKIKYIYIFNKNFVKQHLLTIYNGNKRFIGYIEFDIDGYTKILDNIKINVLNNTVFYRYHTNYNYFSRLYNIITDEKKEDDIKGMCNIS